MNVYFEPCLVSVAIVTYNHEKYIAHAIESVIMQKTNFKIELIIGDDFSTDKTRDICIKYKNKYPDLIRLVLHETNVGFRQNNIITWKSCRGKYVALCEGDDYWTDPYKLQKQVDVLEKNQNISTCFHNTLIEYYQEGRVQYKLFFNPTKTIYNFKDITEKWISHTTSLLFRNFFKDNPEHPFFTSKYFHSDRPLEAFLAKQGDFYYLNETMSVWRHHKTNMTKIGNSERMNFEGAIAFKKMKKIYPESWEILSEQVIRWGVLAAADAYYKKRYYKYIYYNMFCLFSVRTIIGFKHLIKANILILKGKPIY